MDDKEAVKGVFEKLVVYPISNGFMATINVHFPSDNPDDPFDGEYKETEVYCKSLAAVKKLIGQLG